MICVCIIRLQYPRPQLRRAPDTWHHLNGLWQLDYKVPNLDSPPFGKVLSDEILVPYPLESSLGGLRVQAPDFSMFYRREFSLTDEAMLPNCKGTRLLQFEKSDWNTTVYVNKQLLGSHLGGYDPFTFELPDLRASSGKVEFVIGVYDATDMNPNHNQAYGKQQLSAFDDPSGMM